MNANIRVCFAMFCICIFLFGCSSNQDSPKMDKPRLEKEDVSESSVTEEPPVVQNQSEANLDDLESKELEKEKVYEWEERPDSESYRIINMLKENGFPISYYIIFDSSNDPNGSDRTRVAYIEKANFADDNVEVDYDPSEPKSGTVEILPSADDA